MPHHDLLIIGAGPGGYVAALRAAQLGLDVACVEKESKLGGTCLRIGCIPSKALLEASEHYAAASNGSLAAFGVKVRAVALDLPAMQSFMNQTVDALTGGVDGLFKKNKVTRYEGTARFVEPHKLVFDTGGATTELTADRVIIATGSKSAPLKGVDVDGDRIGTSTEALSYETVPKDLIVIGAGAIGLELGSVWSRLGTKVTVVEYLDRILPGMDGQIAKEAHKVFSKQGLVFELGKGVDAAYVTGNGCVVERAGEEPLKAERVLLAVGRIPNTDGLGLDVIDLAVDKRGRIPVGKNFETKVPGVFAVGDVIVGPMLAHKAEEEAVACVEHMVTGYGHVDYDTIAGIVYTEPEVAGVGKTEESLKEAGVPYKKGVFPFAANGRARALRHTEGRVKILAHEQTDRVLGVHILGPRAGALIAEAAMAIAFGASAEDIARTTHAHPTLSETVKEAALAVDGRALHI